MLSGELLKFNGEYPQWKYQTDLLTYRLGTTFSKLTPIKIKLCRIWLNSECYFHLVRLLWKYLSTFLGSLGDIAVNLTSHSPMFVCMRARVRACEQAWACYVVLCLVRACVSGCCVYVCVLCILNQKRHNAMVVNCYISDTNLKLLP